MNDGDTSPMTDDLTLATMQTFNHYAAYSAVRIVVECVDDDGIESNIQGTGFFYMADVTDELGEKRSKMLLISNRHVLGDGSGKVIITLNSRKNDGSPDHGKTLSFVFEGNTLADNYYPHPRDVVDLACVDVSMLTHTKAYTASISQGFLEKIDYAKTFLGSEVLFAGFPANFYDKRNNLPLLRRGILASMPNVDFQGEGSVVIEALVFEGSSGSPVFVDSGDRWVLLGVLSQTWEGHIPSGDRALLGFGLVIKQRFVKELVDSAASAAALKVARRRGR